MVDPGKTQFTRSALRLLHYWWPPVLGWSLAMVVAQATGRPASTQGLGALIFGILAAYSLDRAFEPSARQSQGALHGLLLVTGALAALACGALAWWLPVTNAIVVPSLGLVALLYPRLKRYLLTKLVLLPAVWVVAVIALPFDDGSWFAWRTLVHAVALPIFLLVGAGCVLCDLKDESRDTRHGVKTLPTMAGATASARIAAVIALLGSAVAIGVHEPALAVGGGLLCAAAGWPRLLAVDSRGPLLVDVLLAIPGFLVVCGVL